MPPVLLVREQTEDQHPVVTRAFVRMSIKSPEEIESASRPEHVTSIFFGFISGLSDTDFLHYSILHRNHPQVRHVFFSEIRKRSNLSSEIVDDAVSDLLVAIEADSKDRARNEAFLRYLQPHVSKQMATRIFRTILRVGTRTTRNKLLRTLKPDDAPGIEADVLRIALEQRDENALVGIVYRWQLSLWQEVAERLFEAAADVPWLQRQIVFRSEKVDVFLEKNLIEDPVTELYVRARFRRPASEQLVQAAIERASESPRDPYDLDDRLGLVAWCLGRLGCFHILHRLPTHRPLVSSFDEQSLSD